MRTFGFIIFIIGIVILGFGLNSSQTIPDQVVEEVSGRFTSDTMTYIIGGIACIAGGGALLFFGRKK